jgi:hypothetical protein
MGEELHIEILDSRIRAGIRVPRSYFRLLATESNFAFDYKKAGN